MHELAHALGPPRSRFGRSRWSHRRGVTTSVQGPRGLGRSWTFGGLPAPPRLRRELAHRPGASGCTCKSICTRELAPSRRSSPTASAVPADHREQLSSHATPDPPGGSSDGCHHRHRRRPRSVVPGPLVTLAKALKESARGDLLELLATDPGPGPTCPAGPRCSGNELAGGDELGRHRSATWSGRHER